MLDSLLELIDKKPKTYWDIINKFKYSDKDISDQSSNIPSDEWYNYFDKLLNVDCSNEQDDFPSRYNVLLDYDINMQEALKTIKSLKNNTSVGFDCISNEILKQSSVDMYVMRASGSFSTAVEDLSKKALKLIFMIKRKFHCTHNNTPLLLKPFDSCVKPVLYGSELWGPYILNLDKRLTPGSDDDLEKTFLNFAPEKVHIRYRKFVLGVTKYASNIASMAELGRYPISIFVILQSL
ncbi:unnamed protein product [Mytilus coruscus]|uniref:Uncharacterized protein n=1 Tax=Mytilus coruscus TaxID=42192 RepID=A0A6J8A883_MYTCO|nr:unnamed protein product [Mytilus coruscus]